MSVPVRVLGDRVLVKPDVHTNAPETLPSGITIAKSLAAAVTGEDPTSSVHRGTVIAVGNPKHPLSQEATSLADKLWPEVLPRRNADGDRLQHVWDAADMLRDLVRRRPCVSVGDDILFSHDAGQETVIDDEPYIILREADILAVVEPEGAYV